MSRHISDSERLVIATLNRRENELKHARETIDQLKAQLRVQTDHITELMNSNKLLSSQIRYLVHKKVNND